MNNITAITTPQYPAFSWDYASRFIDYCSVKETTLQGYAVCIRHFLEYLKSNGITEPKREHIKAYKKHLETYISPRTGKHYSAGTQAQYLRACKHLFKWLAAEGLYSNVADNIKGAKVRTTATKREAFSAADIRRILDTIDTNTTQGKRNYAIILLAVTAGLRIIEIQRANIEDIKTIAGQQVLFIQGKGHDEKDDYKKLVPQLQEAIAEYLKDRPNAKKTDPLFTGTSNRAQNQRITEPGISRIIKQVLINAGYNTETLTAHSLRHTSVTLLLKAGATLQEAQQHARHADPGTTTIYSHAINKERDQSEQRVYNEIFKADDDSSAADNLVNVVNALTPEQQAAALNIIQTMTAQQKIETV